MNLQIQVTGVDGVRRIIDKSATSVVVLRPGDLIEILGPGATGIELLVLGDDLVIQLPGGEQIVLEGFVAETHAGHGGTRDLPATFIASARRG